MGKQFYNLKHRFRLESGAFLDHLTIAYHTYGTFRPGLSRIVWICHALTGDSDALSWWGPLFGPGKVFDPETDFIVCANVLGSCYGTTGPLDASEEQKYHQFPEITIRDMVRVHEELRKHLQIRHINLLIGGSLGGQQALEWAIQSGVSVSNLCVIASNAFHSPWGIALNEAQRMAIRADVTFAKSSPDAGLKGLCAARAMAMISYRSYQLFGLKQSETDCDKTNSYKASEYQQYQGQKLSDRFNAFTYYRLTQAMDSHHVGRGRGGAEAALSNITAKTLIIGISSDLLFPLEEQVYLSEKIPDAELKVIASPFGHDAFLIDYDQLNYLIAAFMKRKAALTQD